MRNKAIKLFPSLLLEWLVMTICRGLAHISLHDAVLDGNVEKVKTTLMRYIRKYPAKINEHDVSRTAHRDAAIQVGWNTIPPWDRSAVSSKADSGSVQYR